MSNIGLWVSEGMRPVIMVKNLSGKWVVVRDEERLWNKGYIPETPSKKEKLLPYHAKTYLKNIMMENKIEYIRL